MQFFFYFAALNNEPNVSIRILQWVNTLMSHRATKEAVDYWYIYIYIIIMKRNMLLDEDVEEGAASHSDHTNSTHVPDRENPLPKAPAFVGKPGHSITPTSRNSMYNVTGYQLSSLIHYYYTWTHLQQLLYKSGRCMGFAIMVYWFIRRHWLWVTQNVSKLCWTRIISNQIKYC